jgi:hypothetical protein
MIAFSITPVANAIAGPLADGLFEPWMAEGGALSSLFGPLIGVGEGRGMGLMFVLAGLLYMALLSNIMIHPRIRCLEQEIPDADTVEG